MASKKVREDLLNTRETQYGTFFFNLLSGHALDIVFHRVWNVFCRKTQDAKPFGGNGVHSMDDILFSILGERYSILANADMGATIEDSFHSSFNVYIMASDQLQRI